jgi:hypothetical protein
MVQATCPHGTDCRRVVAFGMCDKHYRRWKKYGDPLFYVNLPGGDDEARFWFRVCKDGPLPGENTLAAGKGPCWLFDKGKPLSTYGRLRAWGCKSVGAHRFSYALAHGYVNPSKLHIDHLCRVPRCVNPDHLEAVPPRINALRGVGAAAQAARRTHCPQGHEYTPENTYRPPNEEYHRQCRVCIRARNDRAAEPRIYVPILDCPMCGTQFKATRRGPQGGRQKTCSRKCGQAHRHRAHATAEEDGG